MAGKAKKEHKAALTRSEQMSRIRDRDTGPEIALRRAVWGLGLRYRLRGKLPGKPDIVFSRAKVAVFVDGCFWHGCPEHYVKPKSNTSYWHPKIEANIQRDIKNRKQLKKNGWKVLRFWEHEVESDAARCAVKVRKAVMVENSQ